MTMRFEVEVGEALPLGGTTDLDIAGATVSARYAPEGGAAVELAGTLDVAVGGAIRGFVVPIPGTTFAAQGRGSGVVVITKTGTVWSPAKVRFDVRVYPVV